jgi:hypothetical protein
MDMWLRCPSCKSDGVMGPGSNYESRGRANGYAIFKCLNCGVGLKINNPGRAMVTKRAKAERIPDAIWRQMSAQWEAHQPTRQSTVEQATVPSRALPLINRVCQSLQALPDGRAARRSLAEEWADRVSLDHSRAGFFDLIANSDTIAAGIVRSHLGQRSILLAGSDSLKLVTPGVIYSPPIADCAYSSQNGQLKLGPYFVALSVPDQPPTHSTPATEELHTNGNPNPKIPQQPLMSAEQSVIGGDVSQPLGTSAAAAKPEPGAAATSNVVGIGALTRLLRDGVITEDEFESAVRALRI